MSKTNYIPLTLEEQALFTHLVEVLPKMMGYGLSATKFDKAIRIRWSNRDNQYDDVTMFLAEKQELVRSLGLSLSDYKAFLPANKLCTKHRVNTTSHQLAVVEMNAVEAKLEMGMLIEKKFVDDSQKKLSYLLVSFKNWLVDQHRAEQQDVWNCMKQEYSDNLEAQIDNMYNTETQELWTQSQEKVMTYKEFFTNYLPTLQNDPILEYVLMPSKKNKGELALRLQAEMGVSPATFFRRVAAVVDAIENAKQEWAAANK